MNTTNVPLSPTDEPSDTTTTTEPPITTSRTIRTPILCSDRRTVMVGLSVVAILFAVFIQWWSFPKVKWMKSDKIDWSVPISVLYNFVFNLAAVGIFGRPYSPVVIQFGCCLFSFVIVKWLADLAGWFDRLTMLLMLSGMILEFLCRRYCRR